MHAVAIEAFQELSARWVWPALLHSVWIGLLAPSIGAMIIQTAASLSHRARHAILLGVLAMAITGPLIATTLQQSIFGQSSAETAYAWKLSTATRSGEESTVPQVTTRSKTPFTEADRPLSRTITFLTESLSRSVRVAQRARPCVLTAWFFGVAFIASVLVVGDRTVRRMRLEAGNASQSINEQAREMAATLGLRRAPFVLVHSQVQEPFLCGIVQPVILLPAHLLASGRSELLNAILAHELAHAARLDHVVNLFQRLVEALLFFHPAIHWLSRSLRQEREFCADEVAIRLTGDPLALAGALESVALLRLALPPVPPGASSLGGQSTSLLPRIQELLGMKPSRSRFCVWPVVALPAAGIFAVFAAAAGFAKDHPPIPVSSPAIAVHANQGQTNEPMISYEVRFMMLDAQPWRDRVSGRLKLVQQEADVCAWIIDDEALFEILTYAQGDMNSNVLQAPKVVRFENDTAAIANMGKQSYVAQVEKVANTIPPAFRPTVKDVEVGVRMELKGSLVKDGANVSLDLHAANIIAMHTLHREERVGDIVIAAQYQVPTAVEKHCRVACEIPKGTSLLIGLGLHDRRGRSSNAAETANDLLQLVGMPPLPARSVACEQLVSIRTHRIAPTDRDKKPSKQSPAPIKPGSASQPSPARP
jgi:beta-lactamase regulating signal transducer with metallopeptidase domain